MTLNGDEIRIKQVIINVLSNAVKYTKQGYITFSAHAQKVPDKPDVVRLRISVADTGIGIKPEDLDKLFVAFERIEEKRNRNIEGTGLGMSIAQRFLNMMGSHLEVTSEYGKGSVFSFELEQKVVNWDPIGDYEEAFRNSLVERANYREKFTAPEARVLVVDDYLTKPIDAERLETMLLQYLPKDKVSDGAGCEDIQDRELPDFLYSLKEIDTESGLNYCGDAEDYLMALKMYLDSAESKAEEIEKYWAAGDIKNTTVKVHALKSASRSIGALELGDFAARLEQAGSSGDNRTLDKELEQLIHRYRQLARDLAPLNEQEKADG